MERNTVEEVGLKTGKTVNVLAVPGLEGIAEYRSQRNKIKTNLTHDEAHCNSFVKASKEHTRKASESNFER